MVGGTVAGAGGGAVLTVVTGGSDLGASIVAGAVTGLVGGAILYPFNHFYRKLTGK
jgi:hypothetical protein